jgi:hypothetical protein
MDRIERPGIMVGPRVESSFWAAPANQEETPIPRAKNAKKAKKQKTLCR